MKPNIIIGATFPKIRYAFMSKIKLPTHPFKPELFLYADGNEGIDYFRKKIRPRKKLNKTPINEEKTPEKQESDFPIIDELVLECSREPVNFIIVCNDFKRWVKKNAATNRNHSKFYRNRFTLKLLKYLSYRNHFIHTCYYQHENFNVTYHVIDADKFKGCLELWNNFQIASVLHRPYHEIIEDETLEIFRKKNILNTIAFTCLMFLDKSSDNCRVEVDEKTFFDKCANLSLLCKDFKHELCVQSWDTVEDSNIEEYRRIYKDALKNSPFNDICKYIMTEKKIIIVNNEKSREFLLKNTADALKYNFWNLGKGKNNFKKK